MSDYSTIAAARQRLFGRLNALKCVCVRFTGPDPDDLLQVIDENLAIADLAAVGRLRDRFDDALSKVVGHGDLELDLRQEINDVLGAAIQLGVTLLPAETLDLGDG